MTSSFNFCITDVPESAGKEFIFGFLNNEMSQRAVTQCVPVEVYVSTIWPTSVHVTVSAPSFTESREFYRFVIRKGIIKHVQMNCKLRNRGSNTSNKGILVQADHDVIVYGINRQSLCTDGFHALPTDVIGTKYFVLTYVNPYTTRYENNLLVVGVRDFTSLRIKLANNPNVNVIFNNISYGRGDDIDIILHRYKTVQIEAVGDLSGSVVTSDKPVTVLSGNKKTIVRKDGIASGIDHLVDMLPPVDTWGKRYITFRIPDRYTDNVIKVISSANGNVININSCGNRTIYHLNMASFVEYYVPTTCHSYITASKAILVVQFTQSHLQNETLTPDPSMFVVPPIEQYNVDCAISFPYATNGTFENFFLIVIKESEKWGLILDGKRLSSEQIRNIQPIMGTKYAGGFVYVGNDTEHHTLSHHSQIAVYGVIAYGRAMFESYAFSVGHRLAPINKVLQENIKDCRIKNTTVILYNYIKLTFEVGRISK